MRPIEARSARRLLLHAYIIVWITTVPLFHLHTPDTTDAWSLLHSGGAHTVFSPDLPGEFAAPHGRDHLSHVSQRAINSPEIGLAIISEELDDRKASSLLACALCLTVLRRPSDVRLLIQLPDRLHALPYYSSRSVSRAPPIRFAATA